MRNSIFPVWEPNLWFQLRWSKNSTTEMRNVSSFLLMFNFLNCNSSRIRFLSTKQGLTKSCKNETLDGYTTFAISPPEACGGDGFAGL